MYISPSYCWYQIEFFPKVTCLIISDVHYLVFQNKTRKYPCLEMYIFLLKKTYSHVFNVYIIIIPLFTKSVKNKQRHNIYFFYIFVLQILIIFLDHCEFGFYTF